MNIEQDGGEYYRRVTSSVVRLSAEYYSVGREQLYTSSRRQTVVQARQMAMYLSRTVLNLSYPEVGLAFRRDHTTVMSACKKVGLLVDKDRGIREDVEQLKAALKKRDQEPAENLSGLRVVFPDKVLDRLNNLLEAGMFGGDLNEVVVRLVSLKLHEMGDG